MLTDCHCHLDYSSFDKDRDEVINKSNCIIINNGTNPKANRKTLKLAKKYSKVYAALGFYPWDAVKEGVKAVDKEIKFISQQNITAIGEVGLDYYHGNDKKDLRIQKIVFEKFIKLANKMDIPLIVHTRNAQEDIFKLLKKNKAKKIVLHMYAGPLSMVKSFLELGCYFSIPPLIARSSSLQKLVKKLPIERILTETDAPFLSHKKNIRNEPSFVKFAIKKIAEIKKIDEKTCEEQIYLNFKHLFKIQ